MNFNNTLKEERDQNGNIVHARQEENFEGPYYEFTDLGDYQVSTVKVSDMARMKTLVGAAAYGLRPNQPGSEFETSRVNPKTLYETIVVTGLKEDNIKPVMYLAYHAETKAEAEWDHKTLVNEWREKPRDINNSGIWTNELIKSSPYVLSWGAALDKFFFRGVPSSTKSLLS